MVSLAFSPMRMAITCKQKCVGKSKRSKERKHRREREKNWRKRREKKKGEKEGRKRREKKKGEKEGRKKNWRKREERKIRGEESTPASHPDTTLPIPAAKE